MIDIRLARPDEYDTLGRLTLSAYEDADILGSDPRYVHALLNAAERAHESDLLVAEFDGTIAGTVTYCPYGTPHAEISAAGEAEFRMLAVDPGFDGRGVGRALVAACEERARTSGCRQLVLSVIAHNEKAARLYARLGFVRAEHRDWRPVPEVHLLVWEKIL